MDRYCLDSGRHEQFYVPDSNAPGRDCGGRDREEGSRGNERNRHSTDNGNLLGLDGQVLANVAADLGQGSWRQTSGKF